MMHCFLRPAALGPVPLAIRTTTSHRYRCSIDRDFARFLAMNPSSTTGSHLIFSFGSNSTAQLRARLDNPTLFTKPATVSGFVRVFHEYAPQWQGCSASLAKFEGGIVHGTVTTLADEEKAKLDVFEEGCDEVMVPATVYSEGQTSSTNAIAYLVRIPERHKGMCRPYPSEQYLCAVAGTLREHWPSNLANNLPIRALHSGEVVERGRWIHPNEHGLAVTSLQALAVEVNLRLEKPWVMPRSATQFEIAVNRQLGLRTASEVIATFVKQGTAHSVSKLKADGAIDFELDVEDLAQAFEKVLKSAALET